MKNSTAQEETLNLPNYTIEAKSDLVMTLLKGNEGIGNTYLTKLTYQQCADYFDIEDERIPVRERLQRDADKPRVSGIAKYITGRKNTVFPSACLVVTKMELQSLALAGDIEVMSGILPAKADRLFIDGQGRISAIKKCLKTNPELAQHHLDVKVIVVPTATVRESAAFASQVFSDFHKRVTKPNPSQNIFFDSEASLSRFAKELLEITKNLGVNFDEAIAVNGKIKHGQLYTLANMTDFISIMVGEKNKDKINALLDKEDNYNLYLALISEYILGLYKHLPLGQIQLIEKKTDWKKALDSCVLTCAIGLKALAFFGRSLIEDALINEKTSLNLSPLLAIAKMPINERGDKLWLQNEIYQHIEGKLKIVRASEKRMARLMCNHSRVLPCRELV